ncbi:MAG: PEP-CTERM sorting domain-containing protein [Calothrix sp. MO_192.B10]|nr:PEP-CTERM sorting domain-containing protein [Calothrix sp. MO_192.B10]
MIPKLLILTIGALLSYGIVEASIFATPAQASPATAGPSNEFVFDTDNSVTNAEVLSGNTVTFGHGHTPFINDSNNNIGTLTGGSLGTVLGIGEPQFGPFSASSVKVSWNDRPDGDKFLVNQSGIDFYIFESGNRSNIDTMAISATGAKGATDFFYEKAINFTPTTSSDVGYWTFGYDLSWLGFEDGETIESLTITNFSAFATVNPIAGSEGTGNRGFVDFDGNTGEKIAGGLGDRFLGTNQFCGPVTDDGGPNANSYYLSWCNPGFENFDTDPDLVYIAAAGDAKFSKSHIVAQAVPEPTSVLGVLLAGVFGVSSTVKSRYKKQV